MWVGQEEEDMTAVDLGWASIGACLPPRDGGGQRGEMRFKYHNLICFSSCTFEEKEKRMVRGECTLLGGCKVFSFCTKYLLAAKYFLFIQSIRKNFTFFREHIHIKLIGGV